MNHEYPKHDISLGLLAGGQGRRMGGEDKGLVDLSGRPLIDHVLKRLRPQTGPVLINANRNLERYRQFNCPVVCDQVQDYSGPLAGIVALLETAITEWVLIAPCDTPSLPEDLVETLYRAAVDHNAEIVIPHDGAYHQPVIALIKRFLVEDLRRCLESGQRKIMSCYRQHDFLMVDFSDRPECFINLNSAEEQAHWLGQQAALKARAFFNPGLCPVPVLGIAAWSGVGKTTLLTGILPLLKEQGLKIAVIKHAHHDFDPDLPEKDSYRLRKAGACQMLTASSQRWALITEEPVKDRPSLNHLLTKLDLDTLDLVLVEGFKQTAMAKLELYREEVNKPLRYPDDASIIAIACPRETRLEQPPARLDLNRIEELAQFVIGFQYQAHKDLL